MEILESDFRKICGLVSFLGSLANVNPGGAGGLICRSGNSLFPSIIGEGVLCFAAIGGVGEVPGPSVLIVILGELLSVNGGGKDREGDVEPYPDRERDRDRGVLERDR